MRILDIIKESLFQNANEIIFAVATAIFAFLGTAIKKILKQWADSKEKREVVKSVVMQVEQVYKDLHGDEKLGKAMETVSEILTEKGIGITDIELITLIEASVGEFNEAFNKESWEEGIEIITKN